MNDEQVVEWYTKVTGQAPVAIGNHSAIDVAQEAWYIESMKGDGIRKLDKPKQD